MKKMALHPLRAEEACKSCGVIVTADSLVTRLETFSNGTVHKRGSCASCGRFVKWVRHAVPKMYTGKYKGRELEWIADNDPEYLKWFLNKDLALGLRMLIGEILRDRGIIK